MPLEQWKTATEIASNFAVVLAALVGGVWAWRRYHLERTNEAALEIGFGYKTSAVGEDFLVEIDVVLTNKGKTKIEANTRRTDGFVYSDDVEKLKYSASLQLRRVQPWDPNSNRHLDWFESPLLQPVLGLHPEINLLSDYEDPGTGVVQFWMEPEEIYHVGAVVVLQQGHYIAKATFIGANDGDFWTRVAAVSVPSNDDPTPSAVNTTHRP
jgi:hypothetical protein